MVAPETPPSRDYKDRFALWDKYEEAAKHFNDLNMRWRLQAMGGLATLVTLSGLVVGEQTTVVARLRAMIILSFTLACAWAGVALLDLTYYNRLLYGAGAALRALEREAPEIKLSTALDVEVYEAGKWAPLGFYALGFVPLLLCFLWAACNYCSLPAHEKSLLGAPSTKPAASAEK